MSGTRQPPPLLPCDPPDFDAIPIRLNNLARWILWRLEPGKDDKPAKVPYGAWGAQVNPIDPKNWSTFATVRKAVEDGVPSGRAKDFSGVGIALGQLGAHYWLCGVDIDTCFDADGKWLPWAALWEAWMGTTYCEVSPSRTGLKVFFFVHTDDMADFKALFGIPEDKWSDRFLADVAHVGGHPPGVDIYLDKRYFTVTGWKHSGSADKLALLGMDELRVLFSLMPPKRAKAGPGAAPGAGKKKDTSRSGKAFMSAVRAIKSGRAPDIDSLREALLADPDPAVVEWTEEKGDDRAMQRLLDKIEQPEAWQTGLMRTAKGVVYQNVENVIHALSEAPDMSGLLTYDTLMRRAMRLDKLPGSDREPGPVEDVDYIEVQCWLQRHAGMPTVGRETVINAMDTVAYRHAYHPIREYLDTLVWDGQARLDEMLIKYAGAAPGEYARAVARMTMLAMVARIFEPGCQVDYVLVLEGEQGIGKSNFIRALGGRWFDDSMPSLHGSDDKRGSMHLRGKWVIEISELHAFSKADIEKLKAMITRREENYVAMYGRTESSEPRQCIFIGTTNRKTYFNDETGNRRFWPIVVTVFDIIGILEARDQLFAEAVHRYKAGEHWWPTRELEVEHFTDEQDSRFEVDVWEDHLLPFLSDKVLITLSQLSAEVLKVYEDRQNGQSTRRIVAILERAGWTRRNIRGTAGIRYWIPPGVSNPPATKDKRRES